MPYVNIKITREGATAEQKEQLITGATQLLVDVLGKILRQLSSLSMKLIQITGG